MSSKLPSLKPQEVIKALVNKGGFVVHHVTGSHYILKHEDGRRVTVPYYNRDIPRGTLNSILKAAEVSREQFRKMLE